MKVKNTCVTCNLKNKIKGVVMEEERYTIENLDTILKKHGGEDEKRKS